MSKVRRGRLYFSQFVISQCLLPSGRLDLLFLPLLLAPVPSGGAETWCRLERGSGTFAGLCGRVAKLAWLPE